MKAKAAALAVALIATSASASECREDVEERLEVLRTTFDDQIKGLEIWSYSWGSIYTAAAITQTVVTFTLRPDDPARTDLIVGAVSAGVGSLTFWVAPLRFTLPLKKVRKGWDDPDRCGLLARAEATRAKVEAEQALGKSWIAHAGNVLVNVGLSLLLGLGYGHWQAALISGVVGTGIGELNLFTQPAKLGPAGEGARLRLVPLVTRDVTGAGLFVAF